jgi:hypothetical protein
VSVTLQARDLVATLSPLERAQLAGILQADAVKDKSYQLLIAATNGLNLTGSDIYIDWGMA